MTAAQVRDVAVWTGKAARQTIRAFYARPIGWLALLIMSAVLAYGGGGVMFWFHAIYRGEQGPAINNVAHWFFDASLGFLALTPALFFILPAAMWALGRSRFASGRAKAAVYLLLVGVLFGVLAGPGPLLHNAMVGENSALGRAAVDLFGFDAGVAARNAGVAASSASSSVALQVLVGIPVYVVSGLVALALVRALAQYFGRSPNA